MNDRSEVLDVVVDKIHRLPEYKFVRRDIQSRNLTRGNFQIFDGIVGGCGD